MDRIDEKLKIIQEELENYGEVSFITNYETAKEIALEYGFEDFSNYTVIDLQSDVHCYLVEILIDDGIFAIEPLRRKRRYCVTYKCQQLIIDTDAQDYLNEELYKHLDIKDVKKVEIVDEKISDECCNNKIEDGNCHKENGANDWSESKVQDFIKKLDYYRNLKRNSKEI